MDRVRFLEPKLGVVGVAQAVVSAGNSLLLAGAIGVLAMIVALAVGDLGDLVMGAMARAMAPGLGTVVVVGGLLTFAGFLLDRSQRIRMLTRLLNDERVVPPDRCARGRFVVATAQWCCCAERHPPSLTRR